MRFANGLRILANRPSELVEAPDLGLDPTPDAPTVHVDIVRPDDLVSLSIDAVNCELVAGGANPARLRPRKNAAATLVVQYAFQHTTEEAVYEGFKVGTSIPMAPEIDPRPHPLPPGSPPPPPEFEPPAIPADNEGPDARPSIPVQVIPARGTRLVFTVPTDERIEFSTAGILAAMGRLRLVVHPLAQPGDAPEEGTPGGGLVIVLPGGLIGRVLADRVEVTRASARTLRDLGAPESGSAARTVFEALELRRARALLQSRAATATARTTLPEASSHTPSVTIGDATIDVSPVFGLGGLVTGPIRWPRPRRTLSRPPTADETAIEAPYRLVISPSAESLWAHADHPVPAGDDARHVELWHSRLGVAKEQQDHSFKPDETDPQRRTVRAVWARDRDYAGDAWTDPAQNLGHDNLPFRMSLDRADRNMLVRQSAETWTDATGAGIKPVPVGAKALWLSGLGAWLDLHGGWDTDPYSGVQMSSIMSWDHIAPLGRDQYVRVVYPGHFHMWGHKVALVKITERKMKDVSPSVAALYQKKILVLGQRLRTFDNRDDLPFTQASIRPVATPPIDEPSGAVGDSQDTFFWPTIAGQRIKFVVDTLDHEGRPIRLEMPLIWVADQYNGPVPFKAVQDAYDNDPGRLVDADGQKIAFAPRIKGGDTAAETATISFRGTEALGTSTPRMSRAEVAIPAVQQLSATGPIPIHYDPLYKSGGFGGSNTGGLWAQVLTDSGQAEHPTDLVKPLPQLKFGDGAPSGSDKAGGFVSPDVPIRGLTRSAGPVGDPAGMASQHFDPVEFLRDAAPKLFGIVNLVDLVEEVTGAPLQIPSIVSEALDRVTAFMADLERAKAAILMAVDEAHKMIDRASSKTGQLQAEAAAALTAAENVRDTIVGVIDSIPGLIGSLSHKSDTEIQNAVKAPFLSLRNALGDLQKLGPKLPPFIRNQIATITAVLNTVLDDVDFVADVIRFINGLDPSSLQVRFRFEWHPKVQSWPSVDHPFLGGTDPILQVKHDDSLVLAVEGHASGKGPMSVEALAEIRDFTLHLLPGTPLVHVPFEHLSFKAGSTGKPEVDVVLGDITFAGILSFVEVIKELIPFDGFSDPPYLDVDKSGLSAGFTLSLPSVAIGVFNLSNMSLGADLQVPFLGKAVTVGFNFCTRERPFTLAVVFLGGGGWFCIRLSPDGLDLLEVGLEAGACLAVDLGVASGSISAMIGIYMRLEGDKGSLTGYFRLRGEVDVLGLISASIELYMELAYHFDTGKMVGRATITVEVSVLCFSASVQISAERQFAGSNGDPSFKQVMGAESGTSPAWSDYCLAFAGE